MTVEAHLASYQAASTDWDRSDNAAWSGGVAGPFVYQSVVFELYPMHALSSLPGRARLSVASTLVFALFCQMMWSATPAESQGFFQQLFGFGSPSPARPAPLPTVRRQSSPDSHSGFERRRVPSRPRSGSVGPEGSGSYTTVCVRMCDGFFFPISHRVPQSRFHHDADACRSRCGESESRLFYHSSNGDMKSAVDLTGRAYSRLPIAFMHRKKLVAGCACKPAPWAEASLIRHEGYALAEGRSLTGGSRGIGTVTVVAGNYQDKPAASNSVIVVAGAGNSVAPSQIQQIAPAVIEIADTATATATADPAADVTPVQAVQTAPVVPVVAPHVLRTAAKSAARPAKVRAAPPVRQATVNAPKKPTRMASAATGSKMVWPGDAPTRVR